MTGAGASGLVRLCAAGFAAYCSYAICRTPLLPLFASDLGAGASAIGFVMGASTLTGILLKLPAGAWSDILGRRPLLVAGALVFATLPFAYLGVSTLAVLVMLRFAHGSATAVFGPVASASLSDIAPPSKRGTWLSTYSTAQGAGQALGPVLAGYLIAAGRFDLAFVAAGVIGLAAPLIVAGWQVGSAAAPGVARWHHFTAGIGEVARNRLVLVTSGAQAAQFVLNGALAAFLPLYGRDVIGLTTPQLGWLFGVQTVTTLAVRPLIGRVSDRAGRRWVIAAGLTVCSAAVLAMSGASDVRALVAAVVAYAAGVATTTAATSAYITDVTRRARYGAAHGVFGTIYDVGDALGPIAAGVLVATVGYARMFQVMALVGFTMSAVFLLTSRSRLPVRTLAVATLLLGWPALASAQFTLQGVQAQKPPVIDGVVADGEWHGAPVATGFVQFEPRRGEQFPFRTEALVLFDKQHVYVAFRAWDPEPLTAHLTQRDADLDRDDAVGVLIDTFGDRQTAHFFAVNVLGTQADARIADDGRTTDFNWDAPWRAAARRTPDGWTAEMSLPLASMNFHVRYTHLGDRVADNVNAIGQVRDDDRRELDSAVSKTLWVRGSAVERIRYDSNYNVYWAQKTGTLRSWQIDEGLAVDLRNRVSAELDYTEEYKRFEKDFRNRQVALTLGYNTREYQSVSAGYEFGRNFDADYTLWRGSARRKLSQATSLEYELQRVRFTPDANGRDTLIHVVRGSHFFTPDLFVRVFYQSNSAIDRRNVQATFVYRYLPPFGTLQMVYQRGTAEFGQRSDQGHTLFVKATTVF